MKSGVVIIGAGQASAVAAATLRKEKYTGTIRILGDESQPAYDRPPLSKYYLAGEMELPKLLIRPAEFYADNDIDLHTNTRVASIDAEAKQVVTATDEVFDYDKLVIATGSTWARHGIGRHNHVPIPASKDSIVLTPDEIMAGATPKGPVVVFDDDHYFMGGVLAEKLRRDGLDVTYVTPMADVSHWTHNTMEQGKIQTRLMETGVKIVPLHNLTSVHSDHVKLACVYTDQIKTIPCASVVMVTMRDAKDALYNALATTSGAGLKTLTRIGDCLAPGTIAAAVYSGHRFAREHGEPPVEGVPFRRELPALADD